MVAAVAAGRPAVDHPGGAGRGRRGAHRRVLPAAAAPGHPRPAQPGGGPGSAPGLAGAELTAWAPLVLLALAVGLAPALVLGVAGPSTP